MAKKYGSHGIAYTYNEPSIYMEFAHDIGVIARREGLINIFVTNGYWPDGVDEAKDFLDAATVDFKGNGEVEFLRKYVGVPDPEPIFQTLLELKNKTKVHIEITDLVVPKIGDSLKAANKLVKWVYDNLGPDTPIHFLRFHPDYRLLHLPLTPVETLEKHYELARKAGLNYVYIGNVPGHPYENTYCPECGKIVVERRGFDILGWYLDRENKCRFCGYKIAVYGSPPPDYRTSRFIPVFFK
jgi:pyruvate formate lyase activating enzyme